MGARHAEQVSLIERLRARLLAPIEIRSASGRTSHVAEPRGREYFHRVVTAEAIQAAAAARARIAAEREARSGRSR